MGQAAKKVDPAYRVICDTNDKEAWLANRVRGIGASEAAIILGESRWKGRLGLYYDKVEPPPPEEEGEWLLWGKLLEGVILDELARRAEVQYQSRGLLLQSTSIDWAIATPDAITTDGEPVEVKNLAWGFREDEWEDQIPEHYLLQCQHQMLVMGAGRCLFGALTHGQRMLWEWVPRDEERISRIVTAGNEFWRRVLEKDPPMSDGHPKDRERLAARDHDGSVELYHAGQLDELLATYYRSRGERLRLEKQAKARGKDEDAAANQIAQMLGNAQRGYTAQGFEFVWTETNRRGFTVEPKVLRQFKIKEPKE